jgi:hypothetical protein
VTSVPVFHFKNSLIKFRGRNLLLPLKVGDFEGYLLKEDIPPPSICTIEAGDLLLLSCR